MKVIKELRAIIKKEGKTIYAIAKAINVDYSSLYKALKDGGNPGAKTIDNILNYLGYEIKFIKTKRKGVKK